jgi:uroporphyrin-III C-methyltransferase/precorrin-2 dehydrogenase/sirohydrochlorin ferrochelatase
MYPVMLSVRERRVLVVGGGEVALRKIEGLLAEGARLTVVAPDVVPAIEELAGRGAFELRRRPYASGDAAGFTLVFAATDDRTVNERVHTEARDLGIWVNVADVPDLCTFHLPARVHRGALQLAVASDGGAPFVVRRLRQMLERRFGAEWSEWMDAAARFRQAIRGMRLPRAAAERRYDEFFSSTVDAERLQARVPTAAELEGWLAPRADEAEEPAHPPASEGDVLPFPTRPTSAAGPQPGLVSLVGGGPGDPGLLTVKARKRLMAADAIVYDRLAAAALPCDLSADVELHCVGKEAGRHSVPQEEINALLVRLSLAGKRTVRLKGGDPFVFGRGSEEAEALRSVGLPYEVIPGVTAAIGATAYAGIPATHRGESVRLTLVTAHESAKGDGPQVRWDLLAQDPNATLVGYMGVANLPEVVEKLLAAGMPANTPAALVSRGTTSSQRTVVSILSGLCAAGAAAKVRPPAIFVIGPTVRHAGTLNWFTSRPLSGKRLGIFAPAGELSAALDLAGADVLETPRPLTPAARVVLETAAPDCWILRSPEEVEALEDERALPSWNPEIRACCVGAAAAERARARGWRRVVELSSMSEVAAIIAAVAGQSPRALRGA